MGTNIYQDLIGQNTLLKLLDGTVVFGKIDDVQSQFIKIIVDSSDLIYYYPFTSISWICINN